jgi:hypothetical protein
MDRPEGPLGPRVPTSSGVVRVASWNQTQTWPLTGMKALPPAVAPLPSAPLPAATRPAPLACGPLPFTPPPAPPAGGPVLLPPDQVDAPAPGPLFYLRAEYLLWWARKDHVPPLVTTGPNVPVNPGALGMPGTTVLFGGDSLDRDPRSGGRFFAGYWLDDCAERAVEVGGFFLGRRSADFFASSDSFPVLSRPFFNLNEGVQSVQRVASPGISTGSVRVEAPSDLWGIEANLRCKLCCGCDWRADLLGGFRYLDLRESVTVTENIQGLATAPPPFTNAMGFGFDSFATRNHFYGGQVGVEGRWRWGRWSLGGFGKVALGTTHQELSISGGQQLTPPAVPPSGLPGNLLALNSNIGEFSRDRFAVVPEVGVSVGYHVTDSLRAFVGYNFLYWSSVVRPGEQIDTVLDITRVPFFATPTTPPATQVRPAVFFKDTDFWAQGLTFGVEWAF